MSSANKTKNVIIIIKSSNDNENLMFAVSKNHTAKLRAFSYVNMDASFDHLSAIFLLAAKKALRFLAIDESFSSSTASLVDTGNTLLAICYSDRQKKAKKGYKKDI
mmetsp:Transcript_24385/g.35799  ORF Transcript_24385/g.35799 Transcript_24385/m.35799 type:complete len:106 (-) Transcript_24385:81-398(-)